MALLLGTEETEDEIEDSWLCVSMDVGLAGGLESVMDSVETVSVADSMETVLEDFAALFVVSEVMGSELEAKTLDETRSIVEIVTIVTISELLLELVDAGA